MIWWLSAPLIAFLVLVVLASCKFAGLTLEKSVKLSDMPALAASLLVAYVLQYVFLQKSKSSEFEKELIFKRIESVFDHLQTIRRLVSATYGHIPSAQEAEAIVVSFEDCGNEINSLSLTISNSHCVSMYKRCDELGDVFIRYKASVTGGNFPHDSLSSTGTEKSASLRGALSDDLHKLSLEVAKF